MKTLFAFLITLPVFAQAGTTCYKAVAAVPKSVPKVLCLEKIYDAGEYQALRIDSKNNSMPATVKIDEVSRHNEDRYSFKAKSKIVSIQKPSCGESLEAELIIRGNSTTANIPADRLEIVVEITESRDSCHNFPMPVAVSYELI
jgi:hypothetical protein